MKIKHVVRRITPKRIIKQNAILRLRGQHREDIHTLFCVYIGVKFRDPMNYVGGALSRMEAMWRAIERIKKL